MPFSSDELERALSEVSSWGLSSYSILPRTMCASDSEARAQIELLDGVDSSASATATASQCSLERDKAVISVSEQGWQVCLRSVSNVSNLPPDSADKDNQTFQTLDDLLMYLSPAFKRNRDELLMSKLAGLAEQ
ncbi:hypothetical protein ACM66B_005134 [Microbotryomycetes sp. NB124-2]